MPCFFFEVFFDIPEPVVEAPGALFGSEVLARLTVPDGLPPVDETPGALFGSAVLARLTALDGLPPVDETPGALFGFGEFMFWAVAAVANRPMVAAARIGIRRMVNSLQIMRRRIERPHGNHEPARNTD
jgi:hypothetical protein